MIRIVLKDSELKVPYENIKKSGTIMDTLNMSGSDSININIVSKKELKIIFFEHKYPRNINNLLRLLQSYIFLNVFDGKFKNIVEHVSSVLNCMNDGELKNLIEKQHTSIHDVMYFYLSPHIDIWHNGINYEKWIRNNHKNIFDFPAGNIRYVEFDLVPFLGNGNYNKHPSPNGEMILSHQEGRKKETISVYDFKSRTKIFEKTIKKESNDPVCIHWNHSSTKIIVSVSNKIFILDMINKSSVAHTIDIEIFDLDWKEDKIIVQDCHDDGHTYIFNDNIELLKKYKYEFMSPDFTKYLKIIDGIVNIYNTDTEEHICALENIEEWLGWGWKDSDFIYQSGSNYLNIWSCNTGKKIHSTIFGSYQMYNSICSEFNNSLNRMFILHELDDDYRDSNNESDYLSIIDTTTWTKLHCIDLRNICAHFCNLSWQPNGTYILLSSRYRNTGTAVLRLYDSDTGKLVHDYVLPKNIIRLDNPKWSNDGSFFVVPNDKCFVFKVPAKGF